MSRLSQGLPSSAGQVNNYWPNDEEIRRLRAMALRGRNSSQTSLSTVSEYDGVQYHAERRGSAPPERDHINRLSLARRSSQTLPDVEWSNSGRRGSLPTTKLGWDSEEVLPYDIARHLLEQRKSLTCKLPLPNGEARWGEMTTTMESTKSFGGTFSGRLLKFKVILLGDCGVGKTSFLQTLLNGKYTTSFSTTNLAMASAVMTLQYSGLDVELHFCDTAGQERYRSITASYYRHAQGCLVFFNVNNMVSFESIQSWLDDLDKYGKRDTMSVLLVGLTHRSSTRYQQSNKHGSRDNLTSDSMKNWSELDHSNRKREVPRAQAEHFASSCSIPFMEVDMLKDPDSVTDTIYKLLDILMERIIENHKESDIITPKNIQPKSFCCRSC